MRTPLAIAALAALSTLGACVPRDCTAYRIDTGPQRELAPVASSPEHQWTGIAVSRSGRTFVNYPRWLPAYRMAIGELLPDGSVRPYPDEAWNAFTADPRVPPPLVNGPGGEAPPAGRFICVQSVHVDDADRLWILDPASPAFEGVVWSGGGPKLVEVDLATDSVARVIPFDSSIAPEQSYLNDIRVDTRSGHAFITDSGLGAIIVVDLKTNSARRLLADHPSTKADPNLVPVVGGRELRFAGGPNAGKVPQVHSDGLALDARKGRLYWQALTSKRLFRAPTSILTNPALGPAQIASSVEDLGETVVTDGMEIDPAGNLYFSALELNAIVRRSPGGRLTTIATDPSIAWPDSFALGPATDRPRRLFFTTARIHEMPWFNAGPERTRPYQVFWIPIE